MGTGLKSLRCTYTKAQRAALAEGRNVMPLKPKEYEAMANLLEQRVMKKHGKKIVKDLKKRQRGKFDKIIKVAKTIQDKSHKSMLEAKEKDEKQVKGVVHHIENNIKEKRDHDIKEVMKKDTKVFAKLFATTLAKGKAAMAELSKKLGSAPAPSKGKGKMSAEDK